MKKLFTSILLLLLTISIFSLSNIKTKAIQPLDRIDLYQITPLHCHGACRFTPTCSQYMKECLEVYGLKGIFKGIKRIFRCHPFGKYGYDPVIKGDEL